MTGTINNINVNVASLAIKSAFVTLGAQLFVDEKVNIESFSVGFSPGFVIPDFSAEDINNLLRICEIDGVPRYGLTQEIAVLLNREKHLFEGFIRSLDKSQIEATDSLSPSSYGDKIETLWEKHRFIVDLMGLAFGREEE